MEADSAIPHIEIVLAVASESLYSPFIEEGPQFPSILLRRFVTGEELLKHLGSRIGPEPSLVITSLSLPLMNGAALVERIYQLPSYAGIASLVLIPRGRRQSIAERFKNRPSVGLIEIAEHRAEWVARVRCILEYWSIRGAGIPATAQ